MHTRAPFQHSLRNMKKSCVNFLVGMCVFSVWAFGVSCVCSMSRYHTCPADGLLSRSLLVRLSRPLREEKRPFLLHDLWLRDTERLLRVASSLEQT